MIRAGGPRLRGKVLGLALGFLLSPAMGGPETWVVPGDLNGDGYVSITDAVLLLQGRAAECSPATGGPSAGTDEDLASILGLLFRGQVPAEDVDPVASGGVPLVFPTGNADRGIDPNGGSDLEFIHFARIVEAYPGQRNLATPILLTNHAPAGGFTLSILYDRRVIEFVELDYEGSILEDSGCEFHHTELVTDRGDTDGIAPQAGYVVSGVLLDFYPPYGGQELPVGTDLPLAVLRFNVREDVPVPTETMFEFAAVPGGPAGVPVYNEFSVAGVAQFPSTLGGEVVVVPRSELFMRGDVTGDGRVTLADAVGILGAAFSRWTLEGHPSAGDVDDNGRVELADVIRLLYFLFADGDPPRPPFPLPGRDPTA